MSISVLVLSVITIVLLVISTVLYLKNNKNKKTIKEYKTIETKSKLVEQAIFIYNYYYTTIFETKYERDILLKKSIRTYNFSDEDILTVIQEISTRIASNFSDSEKVIYMQLFSLNTDDEFVELIVSFTKERVLNYFYTNKILRK